jgi:hypothetical protein
MAAAEADLLATVERSPAATAAHDRAAWIGLFTPDARVEDPYGSRPHVGVDAIGRFYDTFIGPRQIIFHRDFDVVQDAAVVRDLMLEIVMAAGVTLNVPMHLRYDLRKANGDWAIERLRAHWELPTMLVQMLRNGKKALPVLPRMGAELVRNQGIVGTAGFLKALRRPSRRQRHCARRLLDAAVAGDELTVRRSLARRAGVSRGEKDSMTIGEFVAALRGGRWTKMIATGDTVSASVTTPSGRGVVFCEFRRKADRVGRIRYF